LFDNIYFNLKLGEKYGIDNQKNLRKRIGFRESEPEDIEYLEGRQEYNKAYETLDNTLNEEQKKMLSELYVYGGGAESALNFLSFKEGCREGVRLGIELCEEKINFRLSGKNT